MILSIIAICIAVLTFCFTIPMKSFGLETFDEGAEKAEIEAVQVAMHNGTLDKTESYTNYGSEYNKASIELVDPKEKY
jgi:hypothetical protein